MVQLRRRANSFWLNSSRRVIFGDTTGHRFAGHAAAAVVVVVSQSVL